MTTPSVVDDEGRGGVSGLVSVIVPTFNRAYIIGKAIESALSQSYAAIEVIVADDGSTDNTREVVAQYGERVRYFSQANAGPSAARNLAMRQARGEFIAFLDSDDEWAAWKIELQVALLRRVPEAGMTWTNMMAVDEHGAITSAAYLSTMYSAHSRVTLSDVMQCEGVLGDEKIAGLEAVAALPVLHGDIFEYMLLGSLVHTSTVLMRRTCLAITGGFDESLKVSGEDYEFHLRTCYAAPVVFADVSSTRYRVGSMDQLTDQRYMIHIARNNLVTLQNWLSNGKRRLTRLSPGQIRNSLSAANGWLGMEEFEAGELRLARRHLWASIRLGSRNRRVATFWLMSAGPASLSSWIVSTYRRIRHGANSAANR